MNKKFLAAALVIAALLAIYLLWPSAPPAPAPMPAAAPAAAPESTPAAAPPAAPPAAPAAVGAKPPAASPAMAPAAAPAAAPAGAPAAAAAVAAAPPPAAAPAPVGLVVEMEQWKGTVVSNDTLARRLTLKSANGDVHTFTVHHDVANLNSVKAGDNVTVDFVESVAIEVKGAKAPVTTGGSRTTQTLSPKGHNTIYDVAVMQVDVKVTSINHATRQMTVVTSSGSKHTIRVDPSVTAFSQVKVGDQIIVRATEAVAMTITKH